MRTFECRERSIALFRLVPFKNHSKTQYRQKYAGSVYTCSKCWQRVRGLAWVVFGIGGR